MHSHNECANQLKDECFNDHSSSFLEKMDLDIPEKKAGRAYEFVMQCSVVVFKKKKVCNAKIDTRKASSHGRCHSMLLRIIMQCRFFIFCAFIFALLPAFSCVILEKLNLAAYEFAGRMHKVSTAFSWCTLCIALMQLQDVHLFECDTVARMRIECMTKSKITSSSRKMQLSHKVKA